MICGHLRPEDGHDVRVVAKRLGGLAIRSVCNTQETDGEGAM